VNDQDSKRMEYLRNRIQDQQILRDAQVPNGQDYAFFQAEITNLTNELLAWERITDRLDQLDGAIATAARLVRDANGDVSETARRLVLAAMFAVIGALPLTFSLRWSLGQSVLEAGVGLLALSLIAVVVLMRARERALTVVEAENGKLDQVWAERKKIIPKPYSSVNPFPRFSWQVIVQDKK
jgi:hypothetical protein